MISIIENQTGIETRNDEIRKELTTIANRRGGLNPTTLLAVAKNPKSCLHSLFTWDDTEAARKWREAQAYEIIRRVHVTITTDEGREVTVRAFWPVKQVEKDGTIDSSKRSNYLSISDVMNNEEAMEQVLSRARSELRAFSTKYSKLKDTLELREVFTAISKAITPKVTG